MGSISRPYVLPFDVDGPELREGDSRTQSDQSVMMKDNILAYRTPDALAMRLLQFCFAAVSIVVWATTSYIHSFTVIRYLVAVLSLQCLWSLSLAIVDIYALMVKRCIRNLTIRGFFIIGDVITSTLTFGGLIFIDNDDIEYYAQNHCLRFGTYYGLTFVSCSLVLYSSILNFLYWFYERTYVARCIEQATNSTPNNLDLV